MIPRPPLDVFHEFVSARLLSRGVPCPNLQTSVLLAEDVGKRLKALIVEVHLVKKALLWP